MKAISSDLFLYSCESGCFNENNSGPIASFDEFDLMDSIKKVDNSKSLGDVFAALSSENNPFVLARGYNANLLVGNTLESADGGVHVQLVVGSGIASAALTIDNFCGWTSERDFCGPQEWASKLQRPATSLLYTIGNTTQLLSRGVRPKIDEHLRAACPYIVNKQERASENAYQNDVSMCTSSAKSANAILLAQCMDWILTLRRKNHVGFGVFKNTSFQDGLPNQFQTPNLTDSFEYNEIFSGFPHRQAEDFPTPLASWIESRYGVASRRILGEGDNIETLPRTYAAIANNIVTADSFFLDCFRGLKNYYIRTR